MAAECASAASEQGAAACMQDMLRPATAEDLVAALAVGQRTLPTCCRFPRRRSYTWLKNPATGIAFVNSFAWPGLEPVYVFSEMLGPSNPKYVWEAVSHEVRRLGAGQRGIAPAANFLQLGLRLLNACCALLLGAGRPLPGSRAPRAGEASRAAAAARPPSTGAQALLLARTISQHHDPLAGVGVAQRHQTGRVPPG